MNNLATIKNLGLDEQEAQIYLRMLELGGSQASKIAKSLGIKRTTMYPILQKLRDAGFVQVHFRDNKRFYYAQKPRRVAATFGKKLDALYAIVPQLESLEKKEVSASGLRFIETLDELKQFYIGVLDEYKDGSYSIIGSAQGWENLDNAFFIQFRKDRARNNIRTKLLLTYESQIVNPTDPELLREFRYLPSSYSNFKSVIDIFDDKILIVSSDLSSLAVVIQIGPIMDIFRSIFQMLWDVAGGIDGASDTA